MTLKKLSKFQPELVTQSFHVDWLRNDPIKINTGWCMQWAYTAHYMFEDVELWYMTSHAFVRYQDKFYDSERLQGENDWRDLPATNFGKGCGCFKCSVPARHVSVAKFRTVWEGNRIQPNWDRYEHFASKAIERHTCLR